MGFSAPHWLSGRLPVHPSRGWKPRCNFLEQRKRLRRFGRVEPAQCKTDMNDQIVVGLNIVHKLHRYLATHAADFHQHARSQGRSSTTRAGIARHTEVRRRLLQTATGRLATAAAKQQPFVSGGRTAGQLRRQRLGLCRRQRHLAGREVFVVPVHHDAGAGWLAQCRRRIPIDGRIVCCRSIDDNEVTIAHPPYTTPATSSRGQRQNSEASSQHHERRCKLHFASFQHLFPGNREASPKCDRPPRAFSRQCSAAPRRPEP